MLAKFRAYTVAVELYHEVVGLKMPAHLKSQLLRAASSIALNLSEGYGRRAWADKRHFYQIALGSLRECKAIFALARVSDPFLLGMTDRLGGMLYRLTRYEPGSLHAPGDFPPS
jgi:four helix bundle protein